MGCHISIVVPPAVFSKDSLEVEDLTSRVDHHNVVRNHCHTEVLPSAPPMPPVVHARKAPEVNRGRPVGQPKRRGSTSRRGTKKSKSKRNINCQEI